jgi:hypothetical protein
LHLGQLAELVGQLAELAMQLVGLVELPTLHSYFYFLIYLRQLHFVLHLAPLGLLVGLLVEPIELLAMQMNYCLAMLLVEPIELLAMQHLQLVEPIELLAMQHLQLAKFVGQMVNYFVELVEPPI